MRVKNFIEYLQTMPDDMIIHLQTTPDDWTSPVSFKSMRVIEACADKRGGSMIGVNPATLVLTAHIPLRDER